MQLDISHFNKLDNILAAIIGAGGINATVAGGAVRDSVLEKPIADIDVFYQGDLDEEVIKEFFGEKEAKPEPVPPMPKINWGGTPEQVQADMDAQEAWIKKYADYDETFKVDNYQGDKFTYDGMKIQLIKVEDVDTHISSFPCYLSRMLYSEGTLVIPKEAIQDASLKIIRFTEECSPAYQQKLEAKYEDYL